jgi:hypothetical protein
MQASQPYQIKHLMHAPPPLAQRNLPQAVGNVLRDIQMREKRGVLR